MNTTPAIFKVEHITTGIDILVPANELARDAMGGVYSTTRSMCDSPHVRSNLRNYCARDIMGSCAVLFR